MAAITPGTGRTRISLQPPRTLRNRLIERFVRRKFRTSLDPVTAMGHNARVSNAYLALEFQAMRWNGLDRRLKDLAVMATAVKIGCAWCVDYGTWELNLHGIALEKIEAVPGWRDSDLFDPAERLVMEYAEAMTEDPPGVTDELVQALRRHGLDDAALVELTMVVALENLRSRFNSAAGLTGQGFKELCSAPGRTAPRASA